MSSLGASRVLSCTWTIKYSHTLNRNRESQSNRSKLKCSTVVHIFVHDKSKVTVYRCSHSLSPLTVELSAADIRPPGPASYPVRPPRQLHDAKLVPVCSSHSPINPNFSTHPQYRCSLQSISGTTTK